MLQDTNRFPSVVSLIYILYTTLCNDQLLIKSLSCWKALDIHCHLGTRTQIARFGKPQLLCFCDRSLARDKIIQSNALLTVLLDG